MVPVINMLNGNDLFKALTTHFHKIQELKQLIPRHTTYKNINIYKGIIATNFILAEIV